jgi:hypothetical protein
LKAVICSLALFNARRYRKQAARPDRMELQNAS